MHISVRVEGLLERAEGLRERSLHFEGTPTLSLFFYHTKAITSTLPLSAR